jgi:toxin ParE1/3/4
VKVVWTSSAHQDRVSIWDYVFAHNPQAAVDLDDIFSNTIENLSAHPFMGQSGIVSGTREIIPHENYRLIYQISNETIWILALVHTSRIWPQIHS